MAVVVLLVAPNEGGGGAVEVNPLGAKLPTPVVRGGVVERAWENEAEELDMVTFWPAC